MNPRKDFLKMCWLLLEYKAVYFEVQCGLKIHDSWKNFRTISDEEYDKREEEYKKLANILGVADSALRDITIDLNFPSRRLVKDKLSNIAPSNTVENEWPSGYSDLTVGVADESELLNKIDELMNNEGGEAIS